MSLGLGPVEASVRRSDGRGSAGGALAGGATGAAVEPVDGSSDPRSRGADGADKPPPLGLAPMLGEAGEPAGALPVASASPAGASAAGGGVRGVAPEAVPAGGAVPVPLPGVWASAGAERAKRTSN